MKCLRVSMYPPMGDEEPITVVMRDIDMKVGPDYFASENMSEMGDGAFVITDVFEIEEESEVIDATMAAIQRQQERAEDERNMAILYYFDADQLQRLQPGGALTTTQPSPLSKEQITYTLKRLADHPAYKNQTIICHDDQFEPVILREGQVA